MLESQRFDFFFYGPINQSFTMAINGLVTFRAYRRFEFYQRKFMDAIESSANSTFCYNITNRWIGVRLDLVCGLIAVVTSIFCIAFKGLISTDLLILSLQITMDVVVFFSISIRFATEIHNHMAST